ncbi:hypothetical protein E5329_17000 [Petralouisia muris]|uniref:Uncharacterized protein n=1 Tax=Petralouisia muris TaxID=3032872 RepID=A0AC61RT13_9FIRM|nr:hypothetical protein [Petralouisia muris]TGY94993.1 hypothetical protein E5329_17000 [Petralouisia muris]
MEILNIDILNLIIAILAFVISIISLYKSYISGRPYINLMDMFFEPSKFHCYSLEDYDGHKKLTDNHKTIINDTLGRVSYQIIDGESYLLVNMLSGHFEYRDVRLVLAPYQFTYVNTGKFVSEIQLIKGMFKLKDRDVFEKNIDCMIRPEGRDGEKINIQVAYVCEEGYDTSVIYNRLLEETQRFSYIDDIEKARRIINFEKEEFVLKCKNNAKSKYLIKVIYTWDGTRLKFVFK